MRITLRTAAGLFAALWALPGFGLVDLEVTFAPDQEWMAVAILDGGWGLFVTGFIVAGLLLVAIRPRWATEIAWQLAALALLIAVSAVITGEYTVWWMLLALVVPAAALILLGRRGRAPAEPERPAAAAPWARWAYAGLAVLGAVPWFGYAVDMYRANLEKRPPNEITNDVNHWVIQGAFAVALVGFAALAALRPVLRRFNVIRAGVCAAYFGICCLRLPESAAALSTLGAALAIAWGVALLALAAADERGGWRTAH